MMDASHKEPFLRWKEAEALVRAIEKPTERLLMEVALNHAVGFLLRDRSYIHHVAESGTPFDLFLFVSSLQSFLQREDVVRGIVAGTIRSLDDLNPFAGAGDPDQQDPDRNDPTRS